LFEDVATRKTKRKRKRKRERQSNQLHGVTFGPPNCDCALCNAGPIPIDLEAMRLDVETRWIHVKLRSDQSMRSQLPWTPRTERIPPDTTASKYIGLIMALAPHLLDDGPCELVVNGSRASPDTIINEGDEVIVVRSPGAGRWARLVN